MHNLASFADITYFHKVWNQIKHWAGSGSKLFDTDLISVTCTDPESFVREGPTLTIFFFFFWGGGGGGGGDDPSKYHYKCMVFCWRVDNGPKLDAGLVAL